MPLNALAFLPPPPGQVVRPVVEATNPPPKPAATSIPLPKKLLVQATHADSGREIRASHAGAAAVFRARVAAPPGTAEPTPEGAPAAVSPPDYSPLSPVANPVPLVPPGATPAPDMPIKTAHDTVLTPGSSLCDLNDGASAADVVLFAQPCPADLRPTLRPGEPLE